MRIILSAAAGIAALIVLAGCSATSIDTKHMSAADLTTSPQYMAIRPNVPKDGKLVGPVQVQLCQAKLTDRPPTGDEALTALKVAAAKAGGTELADVSFGTDPKQTAHCYSTAHANGTAFVHN